MKMSNKSTTSLSSTISIISSIRKRHYVRDILRILYNDNNIDMFKNLQKLTPNHILILEQLIADLECSELVQTRNSITFSNQSYLKYLPPLD